MTDHYFPYRSTGPNALDPTLEVLRQMKAEVASIVAAGGRMTAIEATVAEIGITVNTLVGGTAYALSRVASFDVQMPMVITPGIYMLIVNGQSKARGYNSAPLLSSTALASDYKLSGGLMLLDQTNRGTYAAETFVPLVEAQIIDPTDNATPDGETIVSGAVTMIRTMMKLIGKSDAPGVSFFVVNAAISGAGIGILDATSQSSTAIIDSMKRGKALADAAGRPFTVLGALGEHGQTDTAQHTAPAFYKVAWPAWLGRQEAAAEALTGDRPPLVLSLSQTSDHPAYGVYDPEIARAQGELDDLANVVIACPTYIFPTGGRDGTDGVHYAPLGSYMNGVYQGLAFFWRRLLGVDWHPLKPAGPKQLSGRTFTIPMHVPVRPLRLSTEMVKDPGNYGFRLSRSADGFVMPIASVEVVGDSVVVTAGEDLPTQSPADYFISYAHGPTNGTPAGGPTTGARGCLCDTQGSYIRDPRYGRRLDNYALIFRV